ncbi:MAG: deoxyribodipyrimidine photo-lyase, partial [Bacteroidota bacterium]
RDLRAFDNAGLYEALKAGGPVQPIFIFDREILDKLEDKNDGRVTFIHQCIEAIQAELREMESGIHVVYGSPREIFTMLIEQFDIEAVYTNHDYEPYARERDKLVGDLLKEKSIAFHTFKDQCIFEKSEILTNSDTSYSVFSPYSRKWKEQLTNDHLAAYTVENHYQHFAKVDELKNFKKVLISLEEMGFERADIEVPAKSVSNKLIKNYKETRDYPAQKGTSRLSVHLRFGTISIRELARQAQGLGEAYLNELIWRDFYMMITWHNPRVIDTAFRAEYDQIPWRNNKEEFEKWCEGKTGYPIIDAGMRQLNTIGYMHNRVRMITASFLTKHLLIDWRWGEAYFAKKLLDYDLYANNGGWQWAAGSGCDAAPYFRIFNPTSQMKKFDPDKKYIKQWIEEWGEESYPDPIVDHKAARERALAVYKTALDEPKSD